MTYVPTISRPDDPRNEGWTGYTGRAEAVVRDVCQNEGLEPDDTVVYLCGNPEMIINVESRAAGPRLPRVPRQEGALLAQGQEAHGLSQAHALRIGRASVRPASPVTIRPATMVRGLVHISRSAAKTAVA